MSLFGELSGGAFTAFVQVMIIDVMLAGDNAVAVGMVAAGMEPRQRRRVIVLGLAAAVLLRIGFALIATQLLRVVGLLFAGGILLLWVCWKMWRELRQQDHVRRDGGETGLNGEANAAPKSFREGFLQILAADLAMSLDNVLAVAGAARDHPAVLIGGLLLSIILIGVAASWIARLLQRHRWIGYLGLAIVLYVALHMMWEGHRALAIGLGQADAYNAAAPMIPISPAEIQRHGADRK
ncbi:MAG TPA: TerC family protein [Caulobacteraceae bacterium]|nr:TerC family protein [Caulobacteraceae bacterium]